MGISGSRDHQGFQHNIYYNEISLIIYYWLLPTTMDAILATIVASGRALIQ
jgi:hypothetical protein